MTSSETLTLTACGLFFLVALLTGIWKWRSMLASPEHRAHFYVDTAHRAALLYSFACLVLLEFLRHSPFSETVNTVAAAAPITFFAIAVATYVKLGLTRETENQFSEPAPVQHIGMIMLITAELGGFAVLFAGFLIARFG